MGRTRKPFKRYQPTAEDAAAQADYLAHVRMRVAARDALGIPVVLNAPVLVSAEAVLGADTGAAAMDVDPPADAASSDGDDSTTRPKRMGPLAMLLAQEPDFVPTLAVPYLGPEPLISMKPLLKLKPHVLKRFGTVNFDTGEAVQVSCPVMIDTLPAGRVSRGWHAAASTLALSSWRLFVPTAHPMQLLQPTDDDRIWGFWVKVATELLEHDDRIDQATCEYLNLVAKDATTLLQCHRRMLMLLLVHLLAPNMRSALLQQTVVLAADTMVERWAAK